MKNTFQIQIKHLLIIITDVALFTLFISAVSCMSSVKTIDNSKSTESFSQPTPLVTAATPLKQPILTAILEPTSASTTLSSPTSELVPQPTETASSFMEGSLYVYNAEGILRVDLVDGVEEYVLRREADWVHWQANFSGNNLFVAYWIQTSSKLELWVSNLKQWDPKQLIALSDVDYDLVGLQWVLGDKTLLIQLGHFTEETPGININIESSYLVNVSGDIVSDEHWSGKCTILAFSPRTDSLATWCFEEVPQGDMQQYIVVEEDGAVWRIEQHPEEILKEIQFDGETHWAWSPDGEYAAYTLFFNGQEYLYYTSTNVNTSTLIFDNNSNQYSFLGWSPDNQYLSYSGKCPNGLRCQVIMEVGTQNIVWSSQMTNWTADHLAWSPNSQYIATSVTDLKSPITTQIVIIDVISSQEVFHIPNLPAIDMVWLMN